MKINRQATSPFDKQKWFEYLQNLDKPKAPQYNICKIGLPSETPTNPKIAENIEHHRSRQTTKTLNGQTLTALPETNSDMFQHEHKQYHSTPKQVHLKQQNHTQPSSVREDTKRFYENLHRTTLSKSNYGNMLNQTLNR